ncbi:hypothetical protein T440DRAFT_478935 [Plenodomus tracheiphilus IPT5]|uniref:Uncharacterized protein n=1 Tax=Plenodomus tracheiphilus IPT5 TaxID=1408161 RepID=A0A6A7BA47_9PLEO|nr:hypothetical protein T440DRAFT_478935 [Plenodomus tracheiphilus IPT5]
MPAIVSSIEDLDALSEDMIQVEQVRANNFVGKSCGSHCLWCLQRQVMRCELRWGGTQIAQRFAIAGVEMEPTHMLLEQSRAASQSIANVITSGFSTQPADRALDCRCRQEKQQFITKAQRA